VIGWSAIVTGARANVNRAARRATFPAAMLLAGGIYACGCFAVVQRGICPFDPAAGFRFAAPPKKQGETFRAG
jgi:hypothetical protein